MAACSVFCVGKPRLHAPYPEPSVTLELYIRIPALGKYFYFLKVIIVFEGGGHHHHCLL